MKREISIKSLVGTSQQATVVINKDGMHIENRSDNARYEKDEYFYKHFIKKCIDMDEWQESWHLDLSSAMRQGTADRKKCVKIIKDKISEREASILFLKDGLNVLRKCK